jgi:peptidoglycan/xylan/chitin deacetylase (PgdA/CDA1 family)
MNILLTFDDGPGPSTENLLEVLRRHNVLATFCVMGRNVKQPGWSGATQASAEGLCVRAAREGHELANHTFFHPRSYDSESTFREDFAMGRAVVERLRSLSSVADGHPMRFRLPYGPLPDDRRPQYLANIGIRDFHWTELFQDWEEKTSATEIVTGMIRHVEDFIARDRDVVLLLHDSSEAPEGALRAQTVAAADRFLMEADARGWRRYFGDPRRPVKISPTYLDSNQSTVEV